MRASTLATSPLSIALRSLVNSGALGPLKGELSTETPVPSVAIAPFSTCKKHFFIIQKYILLDNDQGKCGKYFDGANFNYFVQRFNQLQ